VGKPAPPLPLSLDRWSSACNLEEYQADPDIPGTLIRPPGISQKINIRYEISNKRYFLSTNNVKSNFRIYHCATCENIIGN